MKNLIIIGAGGFGREVLSWVSDIEPTQNEWKVKGFLDDNQAALDGYETSHVIIGAAATYQPQVNDVFFCAIGPPKVKMNICRSMLKKNAQFISLVHPTAIIGQNSTIGNGCLLCPRSTITANVTLGDFVTLNGYVSIGHDAIIGCGTTISAHCDITGFASLGKEVFLGSHAVILPGKKVGDYAVVGAGSVVIQNVKPGTTVFGVPAKLFVSM